MKPTDTREPRQDQDAKKEDRSTQADAGAAPEQSDFEQTNTSRAGAQDLPVPGRPKKIRVEQ